MERVSAYDDGEGQWAKAEAKARGHAEPDRPITPPAGTERAEAGCQSA